MTTLIQQRTSSDCVLACIAMAAGAASWDEVWTQADADKVVASRGISPYDYSEWSERAGLKFDDCSIYESCSQKTVKYLLRGQRAILSVYSLNIDGGHHAVYWDGQRLWDPNEGVAGKLAFRHLHSCHITNINRPTVIAPFRPLQLEVSA
jgi:hypothetical protein